MSIIQYRYSRRNISIAMTFRLFAFFALAAVASAAVLPAGPFLPEHEAPAHYNFHYQVSDPITGDEKHQEESREGDAVRGSYSLVESDGTRRLVEYTADDINGFQAVVHKEPLGAAPAPVVAKVAKPVVAAAPVAPVAPVYPKVAAIPAVRGYPGSYSPYYAGYAHPYAGYAHPYAGYAHPHQYAGYNQVYSPYNHLNNYYHY